MKRCIRVLSVLSAVACAGQVFAQESRPVLSRIQVDVYGYVKLDASYDTQRTAAGDLMFFVLPEGPEGPKREFNMTARETRLGLNLSVPDLEDMRVMGKLETDFYGGGSDNSPNLRLRLAYVNIERGAHALLAGQDWETFITVGPGYAIIPRIVNFSYMADAGALGLRRPQIRLTRDSKVGENTRLIAKLALARTIGQDLSADGQNDGAASGLPTGQGNLILVTQLFGSLKTVASVSGHAGMERVAYHTVAPADGGEPVAVPRKDYDTWSLIGSLSQQLTSKLTLQGSVWSGENLDTYFGGIGQGVNPALRTGIRAQGGWAQFVYEPTAALNVNVGYGVDDPDTSDLNPGQREKNELIFASVFYRVAPNTTWATEYSHLTTSYKGGDDAVNDRIQTSMIFRF